MKKPGKQPKAPQCVERLVKEAGGQIEEVSGPLPDGSSFCTASFPLPKNHWLTVEGHNEPPMPFRMGTDNPDRKEWEKKIREAARYAIRASTMNGQDDDYDPDAMERNFMIGMLGYCTPDGLSST